MLPCLNKQLFGMDCLGCGAQRALLLVVQGKFAAAFQMYPAIFSILILLLFTFVNFFIKFKFAFHIKIALIVISAVIIVASYISKVSHILN